MSLVTVLVVLLVVGVILWAVNTYAPIDPKFKALINIVFICVAVLWLLSVFGIIDALDAVRVPRVQ